MTQLRPERPGRPPVSSRSEIARVGLELYTQRGFDAVTVDDIAAAAGIGRRTFFRYFASKNDVVWGEFEQLLVDMEEWLAGAPASRPMLEVLTDAVVRFNDVPVTAVEEHRVRMALVLDVPALQAHSALRYADWRAVVARFAARRLDVPPDALGPQLLGHLALGAAVAAYEAWLREPTAPLGELLRATLTAVRLEESTLRAL